jgi:putative membrane protein
MQKTLLLTALAAGMSISGFAQTPASMADQKFVKEAAVGGLAEVEMGKLAKDKGASDSVKQFGQKMVDDHSAVNEELKSLAKQKNIDVPTALDAKHQATVDRLSKLSGAAFDRAYSTEMVKDHEMDVKEFQKESTSASDADVKNFASKNLPTLQEHLKMARDMSSGKSGTSADRSKQ